MRLNLDDLGLRGGQHHECTYNMDIAPIRSGGATFDVVVPDGVSVDVERIAGGYLIDIKLVANVCGPCSRCLREVCQSVSAEEEEFVPTAEGGWPGSEAESSPFIEGMVVDLSGLTREAVVLAMPGRVLCSEGCKGLCAECGTDLNESECSCEALEE
jgi:uncharacterized protein